MCAQNVWFVVGLLIAGDTVQSSPECDLSLNLIPKEGNMGESQAFPWLGVLRVHIHEGTSMKIALTGIVLVKTGYAIANADDVAKIPKRILKEDSKAMFVPREQAPWSCRVADYMTHPEYEYETLNTIALLELELGKETFYPMTPVCWPSYSYNASNQLYAVGYTDENQLLEKFINRLQFVEMDLCTEFYNRAGLTEGKMTPSHYQCGFAEGNKDNCVWDNGMAMISNSSGSWTLIGLGLHGPGCAAPARFIDMLYYYPWIESATNLQELDDYTQYRKSAFNKGFRRQKVDVEEIPAHELFNSGFELEQEDKVSGEIMFAHYYPVDRNPYDADMFNIQRIKETAINIQRIKGGQIGNCTRDNRLMYRDEFIIKSRTSAAEHMKSVEYKLSMYDLHFINYTCVKIKVKTERPETAYLYYRTEIENTGGQPDVPDIYRVYPVTPIPRTTPKRRRPPMKVESINDLLPKYDAYNVNVYLKIKFVDEGSLDVRIYGPPAYVAAAPLEPTTTESASSEESEQSGSPVPELTSTEAGSSTTEKNDSV